MSLPKTICMLPWISIEASPIGTARPCCLAREEITNNNGVKFDLNKDNLETIYHSEYMQTLRRKFRQGEQPTTCKLCWDEEAAGRTSKRIHSRIRLKELYSQVDWANGPAAAARPGRRTAPSACGSWRASRAASPPAPTP